MSLPVCCFSCNYRIGKHELAFEAIEDKSPENLIKFFNKYNIRSQCCRRMFLGYFPMVDKLLETISAVDITYK